MKSTDSENEGITKNRSICPGCGQRFGCGAVNGETHCWCMEQPTGLFEPSAGSSCYCPACLQKKVSEISSPAS